MAGPALVLLSLLALARPARPARHTPALLLKQAADSLAAAPLQGVGLARVELPSQEDLVIRRLQGELARRVADNWQSLNEPQRWAIMQSKGAAQQILRSFSRIRVEAAALEAAVNVVETELALNSLTSAAWTQTWDELRREVGQIAQLYNHFRGFVATSTTAAEAALRDFAVTVARPRSAERSLQAMLDRFHSAVVPGPAGGRALLPFLHSILSQGGQQVCSLTQSPHQLVYNLYNIIALTEIKGYAMLQFSYMMLRIYEKGNFTVEAEAARERFQQQATEKMASIRAVLPSLSRQFHRCDPAQHSQGETYLELTKLLQGYIENEVDMNERGTCNSQCSAYSFTESRSCYQDLFCAKQPRCKGRIFDCQFFHADAWVCTLY